MVTPVSASTSAIHDSLGPYGKPKIKESPKQATVRIVFLLKKFLTLFIFLILSNFSAFFD
jgi:hypothetical protein